MNLYISATLLKIRGHSFPFSIHVMAKLIFLGFGFVTYCIILKFYLLNFFLEKIKISKYWCSKFCAEFMFITSHQLLIDSWWK